MSRSNGKLVDRKVFLRAAFVVAISVLALSSFVEGARANVPTVLKIEDISQGSTMVWGRIKLTIAHADPICLLIEEYPNASGRLVPFHYLDLVEVDVDGQVTQFTLPETQWSDQFIVELDLRIQGTPKVRARARCNLHGWSDWSSQITIPEFPATAIAVTLFTALATSLFIIRNAEKQFHSRNL